MSLPHLRLAKRLSHFFYTNVPKKKHYSARKLIGFSCVQMYDVVADVQNYQNFLPFCSKSIVISEDKDKKLLGKLVIGFPPIRETYTSNVTLQKPKMVRAVCNDGKIFSVLENVWKFSPGLESNPQSCIVDFFLTFEFKSSVYGNITTLFFNQLVEQMEEAFLTEAKRRYGKESLPVHKLENEKS